MVLTREDVTDIEIGESDISYRVKNKLKNLGRKICSVAGAIPNTVYTEEDIIDGQPIVVTVVTTDECLLAVDYAKGVVDNQDELKEFLLLMSGEDE